jgi:signal transduction histidine kinase
MRYADANHSLNGPVEPQRPQLTLNPQSICLRSLIEETIEQQSCDIERQGIETTIDVVPGTLVVADRQSLRAAIVALVRQAIDVMPDGGELVVTSYVGSRHVELEVADSGPGVPDALLAGRQTHDAAPRNALAWFASAERVAETHHGYITALNCPEGGAAYTICLPISQVARVAA